MLQFGDSNFGGYREMAKNALGAKLDGATIVKTIVVPKKLVNFVVKK